MPKEDLDDRRLCPQLPQDNPFDPGMSQSENPFGYPLCLFQPVEDIHLVEKDNDPRRIRRSLEDPVSVGDENSHRFLRHPASLGEPRQLRHSL